MGKPIIALATPPLKGALSIIRLSGDGVFELTDKLFSKKVSDTKERSIYLGRIKTPEGEEIDQVILLVYPSPNSMTGEDVVEIIPHGSMVIANQIIESYIALGASYATRGEFTSRGFYNGKMDLLEAEAVNEMINATTVEAKNLAYRSLKGEASALLYPLKKEISDLMALIEVGIDYPEYEDIEQASEAKIIDSSSHIHEVIQNLIKDGKKGRIIKEGISIAIIGRPNVGKSSLLNALINKEKAIVSSIPGTTRDIVEADLSIDGIPIHLLDTAGIRESKDEIEQIGVSRSKKSIEEADLIILVKEAEEIDYTDEEKSIIELAKDKPVLTIYNKADLIREKEDGKIYVSALNKDTANLTKAIRETLSLEDADFEKASLSNARQLGLLQQMDEAILQAQLDAEEGMGMDLIAVSLQSAYNKARELLGEEATNDLGDEIFSRFCVGK